jgi:hypothetical protein
LFEYIRGGLVHPRGAITHCAPPDTTDRTDAPWRAPRW